MLKKLTSFRGRTLIGFVLFAVSAIVFQYNKNFRAEAIETQGTIIDVRTTTSGDDGDHSYFPIYEYSANDGKTYTYKPSISTGKEPRIGDPETIYYHPKNPSRALSGNTNFNSFAFLPLLFGVILILSIPSILLFRYFKRSRFNRLKTIGIHLEIPADYVFVTASSIEGSDHYNIRCQWYNKQKHEVHMFRSKDLKENPEKWLKGQQVSVYVNPQKTTDYFIDTHFINEEHA